MARKAIAATLAILLAALSTEHGAGPAEAATINVPCDTTALIQAIETANNETTNPGLDTLELAPGCTYTLTAEYESSRGLPFVTTDITINGNGATIARDPAAPQFGLIQVQPGSLTVNELTLTGGHAPDGVGVSPPGGSGGAVVIRFAGSLTVINSTIVGNTAGDGHDTASQFADGGNGGSGGAIFAQSNSGTVSIVNSTISGNSAGDGGNGGSNGLSGNGGSGGGITVSSTQVTIANSTITGNTAGNGGVAQGVGEGGTGGGIHNLTGIVTIINSTISENGAGLSGGGTPVPGGGVAGGFTSKNSIVANSTSGGNCSGAFTTASTNNISSDSTCGPLFTQKTSAEINLGPLSNKGGPTQTMPVIPPSAAIDAGDNAVCAAAPVNNLDQRGVNRPVDGDNNGTLVCDIGAFEAFSTQPPPIYTVSTTAPDNDGDCHLPPGDCSLREAITAANTDGHPAHLIILGEGETYTLNSVDNTFNGLPQITTNIEIHGHGSTIMRDAAAPHFRIFEVVGGATLELFQVTVSGGRAPDAASLGGGGINVEPGGTLHVTESTVTGNRSGNGTSSGNRNGRPGGGIQLWDAIFTLTDSTVSGNITGNGAAGSGFTSGGAGGHGAGIHVQGTSSAGIMRSTISGNATGNGGGGSFGSGNGGSGAGIYIDVNATASVANSTVANNIAGDRGGTGATGGSGGGIRNLSTNLFLGNVTLAGNAVGSGGSAGTGGNISTGTAIIAVHVIASSPALGANCAGTAFSAGSQLNLASDGSCTPGFTQQTTEEINLGPLANNGGPTQTLALVPPSSAIDGGGPPNGQICGTLLEGVDQRGAPRNDAACDIGAYERHDPDGDSVEWPQDNCPSWPNPSQTKPNYGPLLGTGPDSDCDGFTDSRESYLGTDPTVHCPADTSLNNEDPDNWPTDMNDNRISNTLDVGVFVFTLNESNPNHPGPNTNPSFVQRHDLNGNGIINTLDVGAYVFVLNKTCSPAGP